MAVELSPKEIKRSQNINKAQSAARRESRAPIKATGFMGPLKIDQTGLNKSTAQTREDEIQRKNLLQRNQQAAGIAAQSQDQAQISGIFEAVVMQSEARQEAGGELQQKKEELEKKYSELMAKLDKSWISSMSAFPLFGLLSVLYGLRVLIGLYRTYFFKSKSGFAGLLAMAVPKYDIPNNKEELANVVIGLAVVAVIIAILMAVFGIIMLIIVITNLGWVYLTQLQPTQLLPILSIFGLNSL